MFFKSTKTNKTYIHTQKTKQKEQTFLYQTLFKKGGDKNKYKQITNKIQIQNKNNNKQNINKQMITAGHCRSN